MPKKIKLALFLSIVLMCLAKSGFPAIRAAVVEVNGQIAPEYRSILNAKSQVPQTEYYPIIFIHGHGGNETVEDTWEFLTNKLDGQDGYSKYGKIWEDSILPGKVSKRSMFLFGFYRRNGNEAFGTTIGKIGGIPISSNEISSMRDVELNVSVSTIPPFFLKQDQICRVRSMPNQICQKDYITFKYSDGKRMPDFQIDR